MCKMIFSAMHVSLVKIPGFLTLPFLKSRRMKKLLFSVVTGIMFFSCNSGDKQTAEQKDTPATEQKAPVQGETNITFKANGETVNTAGWIVQRFVWNDKTPSPWLNIVSNMHMDKRSININLNGTSPGTYELHESGMLTNSHGMYTPDYNKIMDSYSFTSGSFVISEIDTVKGVISGTFSGSTKNSEDKVIEITEGQLKNVKLKSGVTNLAAEAEKAMKQ